VQEENAALDEGNAKAMPRDTEPDIDVMLLTFRERSLRVDDQLELERVSSREERKPRGEKRDVAVALVAIVE